MSHLDRDRFAIALTGELALMLANQVIEACAEQGVLLMPLKGVLLLSRWPSLRGRRDLVDFDLLVRPSDMRAVKLVLRELSFEPTAHSTAGSTFVSDAWPLSVDVHHALFPHGLFGVATDGLFSRAELDGSLFAAPVARMSDEDLLAHLVGHFVKGRGAFFHDKSFDDLQWLFEQHVFRIEDASALGMHLRSLGLRRAAGYVLDHESLRPQPLASAIVRALQLSRLDRLAIAVARLGTNAKGGSPLWWTPHLLDRSLGDGVRSLLAHADEAGRRYTARLK